MDVGSGLVKAWTDKLKKEYVCKWIMHIFVSVCDQQMDNLSSINGILNLILLKI